MCVALAVLVFCCCVRRRENAARESPMKLKVVVKGDDQSEDTTDVDNDEGVVATRQPPRTQTWIERHDDDDQSEDDDEEMVPPPPPPVQRRHQSRFQCTNEDNGMLVERVMSSPITRKITLMRPSNVNIIYTPAHQNPHHIKVPSTHGEKKYKTKLDSNTGTPTLNSGIS